LAETESQARVIEQAESVAGEEHAALQRVEFDRRRRLLSDINESLGRNAGHELCSSAHPTT
jgi:hypothetical protein